MEQYARMWDYCDLVRDKNPENCLKLKVHRPSLDVFPTFQRLYVSLHATRTNFLAGCRSRWLPFKRGRTKGLMDLVFTTLLNDIGSIESHGWAFISDRQKGLVETFEEILPNADHKCCVRHLDANFKVEYKGKLHKDTMWAATYASTAIEFEKHMAALEKLDKKAYAYLKKINPTLWSRIAFSPRSKCSLLVNNLSETFNSFILPARDKPILTMLETIRRLIMTRFQKQRVEMEKYQGPYALKFKRSWKRQRC
ncbi:uncharacterized protein LOC143891052 [Tasmannia lanceolata]|uniref:uncharacterized protein LOC143891052 n=1 Tax=Tasmannia lanceolata TaxID=3420 RepID=UPI004063395D